MKYFYQLTTLNPVILSASTATTNNHECLDYIPGSAILGLVASQLYSQLDSNTAFQYFHSGEVKFGPCYATNSNSISLPTPASWHYVKGETALVDKKYDASKISNHASIHFKRNDNKQYKQCRGGFINHIGESVEIKTGITTKTALENGQAKDGALYSYTYLNKNQTFIGWIECDETIAKQLKETLVGEHFIGRSRSSEFGRIRIQGFEAKEKQVQNVSDQLTLWCLSDCQCIDKHGLPTLTPQLSDLIYGAQGTLDFSRSFIQKTTVSRFNQKRNGLDSQQILIAKGSVLVFTNVSLTTEQAQQIQSNGVGLNTQQGLGWVMVNPKWAGSDSIPEELFTPITVDSLAQKQHSTPSLTLLTRWLEAQGDKEKQSQDNEKAVKAIMKSMVSFYINAREYNNILHSRSVGPSSSQLRRVMELLRSQQSEITAKLFTNADAICKANNDEWGWGIAWDNGQRFITFSDAFFEVVKNDNLVLLKAFEQLTRYDLSDYKDLKRAANELKIDWMSQLNGEKA